MNRSLVLLLAIAASFLAVSRVPVAAQESEFPSIADTAPPTVAAPDEKEIQRAVMRCLSAADVSSGSMPQRGQGKGLVEEGDDRYCMEQKRACRLDPGSFACRNFVRDYPE